MDLKITVKGRHYLDSTRKSRHPEKAETPYIPTNINIINTTDTYTILLMIFLLGLPCLSFLTSFKITLILYTHTITKMNAYQFIM